MRLYDVPLEVRTVADPAGRRPTDEPLPPDQFLWRNRLYVVREVLATWRERTAWWTGAAGRSVHGDGTGDGAEAGPRQDGAPGRRTALSSRWDAADRWVWRVEASVGRSGVAGTYDISREGPVSREGPPGVDGNGTWRMVRVND